MLRFLLLATIGFAVYSLWKKTFSRFNTMKSTFPKEKGIHDRGEINELVQDPVCKLYLSKERAISSQGEFFCSEKCKNEFVAVKAN